VTWHGNVRRLVDAALILGDQAGNTLLRSYAEERPQP
jgi:hypothetical protein